MELRVGAKFREHKGTLQCGNKTFRCALGSAGIVAGKVEGDGGTPLARMALMEVYYRADKVSAPQTRLPVKAISPNDGWCDDPESPLYNSAVNLPFAASHEKMWRDDDIYNICVVLDWNLAPAIAGKGSAIFFHLARPNYAPTEGCIAVNEKDMRHILAVCGTNSSVETALAVS
ncbi:MAG: L,D-transpeptidase family protein [Aquisalinus sp.]|nr:L,D-transpeptidase family protein [Aquisalinus sp.]